MAPLTGRELDVAILPLVYPDAKYPGEYREYQVTYEFAGGRKFEDWLPAFDTGSDLDKMRGASVPLGDYTRLLCWYNGMAYEIPEFHSEMGSTWDAVLAAQKIGLYTCVEMQEGSVYVSVYWSGDTGVPYKYCKPDEVPTVVCQLILEALRLKEG